MKKVIWRLAAIPIGYFTGLCLLGLLNMIFSGNVNGASASDLLEQALRGVDVMDKLLAWLLLNALYVVPIVFAIKAVWSEEFSGWKVIFHPLAAGVVATIVAFVIFVIIGVIYVLAKEIFDNILGIGFLIVLIGCFVSPVITVVIGIFE